MNIEGLLKAAVPLAQQHGDAAAPWTVADVHRCHRQVELAVAVEVSHHEGRTTPINMKIEGVLEATVAQAQQYSDAAAPSTIARRRRHRQVELTIAIEVSPH